MKLAIFALVLSVGGWASWLWLWSIALTSPVQWEARIWFDDWERRGYMNEAWVEGGLFIGAIILNIIAAVRLAKLVKDKQLK